MSDRWISQSGAGTSAGTSFANRAPWSDFGAQESAVTAGETLYISAETITLTAVPTITADGKNIVGVNATTGVEDGSVASLNAGSSHANALTATGRNFTIFKNLELYGATSYGLVPGGVSQCINVKTRNNGSDGIFGTGVCEVINCSSINNSGNGIRVAYSPVSFSFSAGNGGSGYYGEFSFLDTSIAHGNAVGAYYFRVLNSVIDGNTIGVQNVNGGAFSPLVSNSSITNNGTGLYSYSSGRIYEFSNYFYNNTTKIGGTTANTKALGASVDGIIDPYTNQASDNFTPSATAPKLNTEYKIGLLTETTNLTYLNAGLNPEPSPPSMTVTDINPATGASGATITITGTNFSGSGNIVKLGGSGGTSCTVTTESTTSIEFTVPAIATGTYDVYIENADGANLVVPNGFVLTSATVPVFAGITHFEILSNNKFYIKTGTATNSPIYLVYYISTTTNPFAGAYSFKLAYSANKELVIGEESGHFAPLVAGTRYYCGVRAENANGEDVNTAELSNLCSGTAMIQRQTITVLSAK